MHNFPTIESIEEYLDGLKTSIKRGSGNVPVVETIDNKTYKSEVSNADYWRYIQSADYHYFISRVLFLQHIVEYSHFSGHQCIENYLKAYLKYKKQVPPNSHELDGLLNRCRSAAPKSESFIHGGYISIITKKYEPFYELARYPVQRKRPQGGYASLIPDDIFVLDYFVSKMRNILDIPENTWDILDDGHYHLADCQRFHPNFYKLFFQYNINFSSDNNSNVNG
jgi:HEPN domain-containing protein